MNRDEKPSPKTSSATIAAALDSPAPARVLSPEAQRALAEAEARRQAAAAVAQEKSLGQEKSLEINGRGGLDPVRYGDWEIKGLTSDF